MMSTKLINTTGTTPLKPKPVSPKSSDYSELIPVFTESELLDLKAFLELNKKYSKTFRDKVQDELKSHPAWGPIISKMTGKMMEDREKLSAKLQEDAIVNGNWEPYIQDLIGQGKQYAKVGVNFKNWLDIVSLVRKYIIPLVEKESGKMPDKSISVLRGMNLFMDNAIRIIGETYLDETKKIIEKQNLAVSEQKEATQYVRSLIEASIDPLGTINREGIIMDVNESAVKATGISREKLIGSHFSDYFTEPEKVNTGFQLAFKRGYIKDYPLTIKHSSGRLTDVLFNASVYKDQQGKVIGLFGAGRDITQQKKDKTILKEKSEELEKLNEELKENEQQIRAIFNGAPDAVVVIDHESTIIKWNSKAEVLFGWEEKEAVGKHIYDLIIPERYRQRHKDGMKHYLQTGEGPVLDRIVEMEGLKKNGTEISVLLSISPAVINTRKLFIGFIRNNTKQKQAEEALRLSEEKYRKIVEEAGDAVYNTDYNGYFTYVNPLCKKFTGYLEDEMIGMHFLEIIAPEWKEKVAAFYKEQFKKRIPETMFSFAIITKSGTKIWVEQTVTLQTDGDRITGHHAIVRDITERIKAEEILKEYMHFFYNTYDLTCIADFNGYFVNLNPNWEKKLGYTEKELKEKQFLDFIHPDDVESTRKELETLKTGKSTRHFINRYRKKDGTHIWLDWISTPDAATGKLYAIARDITKQKQAEDELKSSEIFLNSIIENIPNMIFVKDAKDLRFVRFNKAGEELFGYSKGEMIGKNDYDFFPPEEADFFTAKDRSVLDSGKELHIPEESIHTKFKGERILETRKIPINDNSGKPAYLLGISHDITEQKRSFQYGRSLIEASLDPFITIGADGKITDINEALVKVTGVSRDKLIGTDFSDYFTEPDKARQAYTQVFQNGFAADFPLTIKHTSGTLTDVLYNASVYKDSFGKVIGVFSAVRDITAQKQLAQRDAEREKELMRIEELERFRKLTVGRELKMIELKKEIEELQNKIILLGKK